MYRFRNVLVLSFIIFFQTVCIGQNNSGSVYSIFGIGELTSPSSVQAKGMGYTSIGLSSPFYVNIVNPAANDLIGNYSSHVADIGFYYASIKYQSQGITEQATGGGLSNLSWWFRFSDRWTGLIGMSPYSNVGYNIDKKSVNTFQDGESHNILYSGNGGLNEVYFSNGYTLMKNLTLGLKLSFIFGNIEHSEEVSINQDSRRFTVDNSIHITDIDTEYSLNYRLHKKKYDINIGLIYKNPTSMSGTAVSMITDVDFSAEQSTILYEERESVQNYTLPRRVGLGISYVTPKVIVAGDVEFNQWSQGSIENYLGDLTDTWRYSLGFEWTPSRFGDRYTSRVSYRIGGYFENSYLKVDGTGFNKYGFTTGLSMPLPRGNSINLAFHKKFNGTFDNDLIYETTNELSVNFTIRQKWFQRAKYN